MKAKKTNLKSGNSFSSFRLKKLKRSIPGSLKSRIELAKANSFKLKKKKKGFIPPVYWKKARKIGLFALALFLVVFVMTGIYFITYLQKLNDQLPEVDKVFPTVPIASEIYDRISLEQGDDKGTKLYRVIDERYNSDPVNIDEIPPMVWLPFLAAEDESFLEHKGFDPAAIVRCGFQYVKNGRAVCGGSTITQQLVKITTEESEQKIERKINELLLAIKVEQSNDKLEILQMYLQVVSFAPQVYGVDTASQFYFGKDPKDLTLAEATLLASLIQDPITLSPTQSYREDGAELAKKRQLYVLDQLDQNKDRFNDQIRDLYDDPEMDDVLTDEMIEEAKVQELAYRPPVLTDIKAGHFVNYTLEQLQKRNYKNGEEPFTIDDLRKGGYKIYTTLDYGIQRIAEDYAARAGSEYSYWNANNAAVLTITPSNGQIIAMAGSKSFYGESEGCDANGANCKYNPQVNVLTTLQSPGSTNKPLGYYLAYKQGRLFTGSFLPDVDINIGTYDPRNWNDSYNGVNYTAEQALRDSRNIPALHVAEIVGVDTYVNTAREFGYTSYNEDYGHSVILGGTSVYPVEHAQAYGVFANGGDFVQIDPILKIVDKDGNTVYEANPQRKPLADPQATWLLNQTLKNYDGMSWDQRDMAGKTGTTEENKDAWFVGYSPDFVSIGWVGNNNNDPMDPNFGYPPYVVEPWWRQYMNDIGGAPYFAAKTPFTRPGFVYEGGGDCNDEGRCLGLNKGWLIQDREPARDIVRSKKMVCTDQPTKLARPIDEALGFAREIDVTYYISPVAAWQGFVDQYLLGKSIEKPNEFMPNGGPTEYCDVDRTGGVLGPVVVISYPTANATILGGTMNVKGSAFTTSGSMTEVRFYINEQYLGVTNTFPNFDVSLNIASQNLDNGTYTVRVEGRDNQGRINSKTVRVILGSENSSNFTYNLPTPSPLVHGTDIGGGMSKQVRVTYTGTTGLGGGAVVKLYQLKNGANATEIGNMNPLGSGQFEINWGSTLPNETAQYTFYTVITTTTGATLKSNVSGIVQVNAN